MISKKLIIIISILTITSLTLSSCSLKSYLTQSLNTSTCANSTYIDTIFNKDTVININIEMSEEDWQSMLDTAIDETYVSADITVNDKTYNNVAIRPKGNSSLSQVYSDDTTDRYSFKIKFDKYVDDQTLDGLSELVLNNNMSDATSMKEYLSYDLLSTLGVPTPECSYANITVNGEPWGLYLAVEPVDEDFIERSFGSVSGNLYKPGNDDDMFGGNGNMKDNPMGNMNPPNNNGDINTSTANDGSSIQPNTSENTQSVSPPDMNNITPPTNGEIPEGMTDFTPPTNGEMPESMTDFTPPTNGEIPEDMTDFTPPEEIDGNFPQGDKHGGGMMGNGNTNGADLVWNGDDISNYSAIFDNAKFKTTTSDDYTKILDMIEHLDTMDDIESYLNVDEVLRYFAANTFLVNLDSYVSNMKHNYYLYEENGLVSILPWDYNLSFAGFQAGTASSAINFPIDSPVSGDLESSPLIAKLLEVDKYKELYHSYLNDIVENYINNGTFENTINRVNLLISDYVENDPTAFYTFDEYTSSLSHLINFGYDRATSIAAQLEGTQPSTTTGTIETTVDLNALGTQGNGNDRNKGGMDMPNGNPPNMPNMNNITNENDASTTNDASSN